MSHKNLDRICENNRGINRKVDSQQLEYIVTAVPGTSVYARLAQLLFPSINQCWWRHYKVYIELAPASIGK